MQQHNFKPNGGNERSQKQAVIVSGKDTAAASSIEVVTTGNTKVVEANGVRRRQPSVKAAVAFRKTWWGKQQQGSGDK